jgi:DNA repair protein RadA/Sms
MPRAKIKTAFVCDSCGNDHPKWEGRCPACGEWNTLVEVRRDAAERQPGAWLDTPSRSARELSQVSTDDLPRLQVSSGEVNRVLGGGVVPGSVTLIAGDPGIGKSTLLLAIAGDVARTAGPVLYVSGEESAAQLRMRADRLGVAGDGLFLLESTAVEEVVAQLDSVRPVLAVVDSVQTMYDSALASAAGSVAQIRECSRALMAWAKSRNAPAILTGHVTKGGDVAGPRVLEHMVDVVLYMEGDPISSWRLLRSAKNRFGSTNELGVFEMRSEGLVDVPDPSQVFLGERRKDAVGSVVVATIEGTRPLLVEVQALTNPSLLPAPRRVATGVDFNRLLLVCAVLTRRTGISLADQDVVVSVTGGLRVSEPAADLGIALAVASSMRNATIPSGLVAFGEIGLAGEIRAVPQAERRIAEAERLGLTRHVSAHPSGNGAGAGRSVGTLGEALSYAIPRSPRRTAPEIEMGVPRG